MVSLSKGRCLVYCEMCECSLYHLVKDSLVASSTMSSCTSTSTKYNRTKRHNLEHFTKVLAFTAEIRVKVKHTQQLVLDRASRHNS